MWGRVGRGWVRSDSVGKGAGVTERVARPVGAPVPTLQLAVSSRGAGQQRRMCCVVLMQVLAIDPFGYEMAVLMAHHHFRAAPGKTVPFREGDGVVDRAGLAWIGLGKSSAAPDNPP